MPARRGGRAGQPVPQRPVRRALGGRRREPQQLGRGCRARARRAACPVRARQPASRGPPGTPGGRKPCALLLPARQRAPRDPTLQGKSGAAARGTRACRCPPRERARARVAAGGCGAAAAGGSRGRGRLATRAAHAAPGAPQRRGGGAPGAPLGGMARAGPRGARAGGAWRWAPGAAHPRRWRPACHGAGGRRGVRRQWFRARARDNRRRAAAAAFALRARAGAGCAQPAEAPAAHAGAGVAAPSRGL